MTARDELFTRNPTYALLADALADAVKNVDFGTLAEADFNAQVDLALNTAIPASNTANSVNDVLLDKLLPTLGALADAAATGAVTEVDSAMKYIKQLVTELQAADAIIDTIVSKVDPTVYPQGLLLTKATTFELNQGAASYTLLTGTTQDVLIESVTVRNLTDMTGGGCTSFSVHTNDTTAQVFISDTSAIKASLTVGAQFAWAGVCILKATKLIQVTINGAAAGGTDVMDIVVTYRPIVAGGYLV